jgi:hypothetical protein
LFWSYHFYSYSKVSEFLDFFHHYFAFLFWCTRPVRADITLTLSRVVLHLVSCKYVQSLNS